MLRCSYSLLQNIFALSLDFSNCLISQVAQDRVLATLA